MHIAKQTLWVSIHSTRTLKTRQSKIHMAKKNARLDTFRQYWQYTPLFQKGEKVQRTDRWKCDHWQWSEESSSIWGPMCRYEREGEREAYRGEKRGWGHMIFRENKTFLKPMLDSNNWVFYWEKRMQIEVIAESGGIISIWTRASDHQWRPEIWPSRSSRQWYRSDRTELTQNKNRGWCVNTSGERK